MLTKECKNLQHEHINRILEEQSVVTRIGEEEMGVADGMDIADIRVL